MLRIGTYEIKHRYKKGDTGPFFLIFFISQSPFYGYAVLYITLAKPFELPAQLYLLVSI